MKLGIGSYAFAWAAGVPGYPPAAPMTVRGLLEKAVRLGVGVVQVCDNLPLSGLPRGELENLAAFAREHQIEIEVGTRDAADRQNLLDYLRLARFFGASFVRLVVDGEGSEPSPEETVDLLQPLMKPFADAGVKLALENHDRFTSKGLVQIIQSLGVDWTGVCLDSVNSFGALEGPAVVVRELGPYTVNLHLKDFRISRIASKMGFQLAGAPTGHGQLDVPWLLESIGAHGGNVNAIIELWTPWSGELEETIAREEEWAIESVRTVRNWIRE